ncbi:uncharacterized protein LOC131649884 [Vicia villosa]|uniref:uncharacterized protein LOC131649884 n=1 Tax=Vicia villosa TaxID=3911 RepID=UPI00273AA742|nr:uncharacterized protein LOC131649884 [Vicia villosa]
METVYASNCHTTRRNLWNNLSQILSDHALLWCIVGDFNAIQGAHEHQGSHNPNRVHMMDFSNWSNGNNLLDIPSKGNYFTWSNGKVGRDFIQRRLDRSFCNQLWISSATIMNVSTLNRLKSDHFPLLLEFSFSHVQHISNFRFLGMWILHDSCEALVKKVWSTQEQLVIHSDSSVLKNQELTAQKNLEKLLIMEESFWKDNAKIKWHLEGDRNTSYFHKCAKIRQAKNTITHIRTNDGMLHDPDAMAAHAVNYFTNLFCFAGDQINDFSMVDEVIPDLVNADMNRFLTSIPSEEEIKNAVFKLNKDGAPGPDGFGGIFYHTYWSIIKKEVIDAVIQFFKTGWILPKYNSNNIILLPKHKEADTMESFRTIALANFKFKILSKILSDRLATLMPSLISVEQRGFIKGRCIKDCICTASEAINHLHNKAFGGNMALKVDITKAFDTINWNFLLHVLRSYGFNHVFCSWIKSILHSAYLSISFNRASKGFFNCKRGVRQGDPVSPLLFCLSQDVLSRSITKLITIGNLKLIKTSNNLVIPSHVMYADDILIFCKASISNVNSLTSLFTRYYKISDQFVNSSKSSLFPSCISNSKIQNILNKTGFSKGSLPFMYLGVPLFKGKPKTIHLRPIADRILAKMAGWKGSTLSMAGRVCLVKSIIEGMLNHTIAIYDWPVAILKEIEKAARNFIWSGSTVKRKICVAAWNKICRPKLHGGLGIRSLLRINEDSNLRLAWDIRNSVEQWAVILIARVLKGFGTINYHIFSSIWSSIKAEWPTLIRNCAWILGNGSNINFWLDNWCGNPLVLSTSVEFLNLHDISLKSKVRDFIHDSSWNIPLIWSDLFPFLEHKLNPNLLSNLEVEDICIWPHCTSGILTLQEAYKFKNPSAPIVWTKAVWNKDIPPSKSIFVWKLMMNKLATDDNLTIRGCNIVSICSLCRSSLETA